MTHRTEFTLSKNTLLISAAIGIALCLLSANLTSCQPKNTHHEESIREQTTTLKEDTPPVTFGDPGRFALFSGAHGESDSKHDALYRIDTMSGRVWRLDEVEFHVGSRPAMFQVWVRIDELKEGAKSANDFSAEISKHAKQTGASKSE